MQMVVSREKQELRQKLLQQLLALSETELKRRSNNVADKLSGLPIYQQAKTIMVYYPLRGEVDIWEMIRKDFRQKRFCFPVMDLKAKNLRAFAVKQLDEDFVAGPFAVKEPDTKKAKEVRTNEIELVVVPGLAFDHKRNRLGRGAGFYDQFLKELMPPAKKIGIAFEFQILNNLPIHLPKDQKVDLVVSENTII